MEKRYDVVVVGGGVSGSSTAYFLAANPDFDGSVLVVEKDPTYHNSPSARATGGFRQQFSTVENIRIGLFGAHFIQHLDDYLRVDGEGPDVAFREHGYLLLATERMLPAMRDNHRLQLDEGADIAFLSCAQLADRFPWLDTTGLAGGFLGLSQEGWVDPHSLLQGYRRKARALGVSYVADEAVALNAAAGRIESVALRDSGLVLANAVVNAAGASGARRLAHSAGITLPIESRKRCTFVFECKEPRPVTPLTILPQGLAFRPEGATYLCNMAPAASADLDTDSYDIDYALFDETMWPLLAERVPQFEAIKMTSAWCCHYDFNTFDENAIIGRLPPFDNLYALIGFSGHGLQQSPAMGRGMSELITYGGYRSLDLSRLGYERVPENRPVLESNCY